MILALSYAYRGWPVFPCIVGDKPPATSHGVKDATTDKAQIKQWWEANPAFNIGIATGNPSGLLVIDIDMHGTQNGIAAWWEIIKGKTLDQWATFWVVTPSGGWHFYYTTDSDVKNTASVLGPGVDTRGTGGYIIAPPSMIGNKAYTLDHIYRQPRAVPDWLLEKLTPPPRTRPQIARALHNRPTRPANSDSDRYSQAALESELDELRATPEGRRNAQLNTAAFNLGQLCVAGTLEWGYVYGELLDLADEIGLERHEIGPTIQSGFTSAIKKPRHR